MLSVDITVDIASDNNKASDWIVLGIASFCWLLLLIIEIFLIAKFRQKPTNPCIKSDTKIAVLIGLICFHISMTLDIYGDLFVANEKWTDYPNILAIILWGIGSFFVDLSFVLKIGAFDKNSISKWHNQCSNCNKYAISDNKMKQQLKKYGIKLLYTSLCGLLLQMLIVLLSLLYSYNILSFKISSVAILILLACNCIAVLYLMLLLILVAHLLLGDIRFQHSGYRPEYKDKLIFGVDKVVRQTILSLFSFITTIAWFIMAIFLAYHWITAQITHNQDACVNFEKYVSFSLFFQSLINAICLFLQFEFNITNGIYNICCFCCRKYIIQSRNKSEKHLLNRNERVVPNYQATSRFFGYRRSDSDELSIVTSSPHSTLTASNPIGNHNNSDSNNPNANDEMNDRMDDEKQAIKRRDEILATFFRDLGLFEDNDNNIG